MNVLRLCLLLALCSCGAEGGQHKDRLEDPYTPSTGLPVFFEPTLGTWHFTPPQINSGHIGGVVPGHQTGGADAGVKDAGATTVFVPA